VDENHKHSIITKVEGVAGFVNELDDIGYPIGGT